MHPRTGRRLLIAGGEEQGRPDRERHHHPTPNARAGEPSQWPVRPDTTASPRAESRQDPCIATGQRVTASYSALGAELIAEIQGTQPAEADDPRQAAPTPWSHARELNAPGSTPCVSRGAQRARQTRAARLHRCAAASRPPPPPTPPPQPQNPPPSRSTRYGKVLVGARVSDFAPAASRAAKPAKAPAEPSRDRCFAADAPKRA